DRARLEHRDKLRGQTHALVSRLSRRRPANAPAAQGPDGDAGVRAHAPRRLLVVPAQRRSAAQRHLCNHGADKPRPLTSARSCSVCSYRREVTSQGTLLSLFHRRSSSWCTVASKICPSYLV